MTPTDAFLSIACASALTGVLTRNVTAAALLASFVFSTLLCRLGVPFNFILWVSIDLAVILCIIHPGMRKRDLVILALFIPIWIGYLGQWAWAPKAIDILVGVQMLITFPVRRALAFSKGMLAKMREDDTLKLVTA